MNIKQYCKRVIDDCLNLEVKSKPFMIGLITAGLTSLIFSPFIGIPLGMMTASYCVQKKKLI